MYAEEFQAKVIDKSVAFTPLPPATHLVLRDNAAMERFFRSLKTENMPKKGYKNSIIAADSIRDYIYKYYNSIRPHSHNLGLSPNEKETYYWKTFNSVAKKG